jgi:putative Mg2+ transporter-C (MgtC) family protein
MDTFFQIVNSSEISLSSSVFKLLLSVIAGGLIGLNREKQKQAAGFRTHILICVGSTLLMILSIYIPQTYFDLKNGDPGRIAAQVVSGIGFLGAGAIIRLGNNVRGLTTAASIWLISAIGLSIGAGLYLIAFITVAFALFTLVILERTESKWIFSIHQKTISVSFSQNNFPEYELKQILQRANIIIRDYSLTVSPSATEIQMTVKISAKTDLTKVIENINLLPTIRTIKIY